jgi:hypothetical protein
MYQLVTDNCWKLTLGSGLGRSMGEIVGGRVIQGCGGAGMVVLVSILITGLLIHNVLKMFTDWRRSRSPERCRGISKLCEYSTNSW